MKMKKMIVLAILFAGFLLTGCSVDLFTSNEGTLGTKIEKFEDSSEELEDEFMAALEEIERLEEKNKLSSQDQKQIVAVVDNLSAVLDEFQEEEAPMLNWLKDYSVEKVMERVETLEDIKEKAQNGDATIEDVRVMKEALTDDFELGLFGN
jgi:outer membrane murein-binding lipoprotein Lpp